MTRISTKCWSCRAKKSKCDGQRPACTQCIRSGRRCGGYAKRLVFDTDSANPQNTVSYDSHGRLKVGFRGTPKRKKSDQKPSKESFRGLFIRRQNEIGILNHIIAERDQQIFPAVIPENLNGVLYTDEGLLSFFYNSFINIIDNEPSNAWYELAMKLCDNEMLKEWWIALAAINLYCYQWDSTFYRIASRKFDAMNSKILDTFGEEEFAGLFCFQNDNKVTLVASKASNFLSHLQQQDAKNGNRLFLLLTYLYVNLLYCLFRGVFGLFLHPFTHLMVLTAEKLDEISSEEYMKQFTQQIYYSDIILAVSSSCFRRPFCRKCDIQLTPADQLQQLKVVGCPVQILECIYDIAVLRCDLATGKFTFNSLAERTEYFQRMKARIVEYDWYLPDDYAALNTTLVTNSFSWHQMYIFRHTIANMWALGALGEVCMLVEPQNYKQVFRKLSMQYRHLTTQITAWTAVSMQPSWPLVVFSSRAGDPDEVRRFDEHAAGIFNHSHCASLVVETFVCRVCRESGKNIAEVISQNWRDFGVEIPCL